MVNLENVLKDLEIYQIDEINGGSILGWFGYTIVYDSAGNWEITRHVDDGCKNE